MLPIQVKVSMPWGIQPQTEVKHRLLVEYLNRWLPILAQGKRSGQKVVFVDGFAGPGRYAGGEPGSPIVALETALDHIRMPALLEMPNFSMSFVFIDGELAARDDLAAEIATLRARRAIPRQIEIVDPVHGEFGEHMTAALDLIEDQGKQVAPTLVFIDPFGPLGFPMKTIRRIMLNDRSEVFLRFNYTRLANNFMQRSDMRTRVDEIFGSDAWRHAAALPADRREDAVMEVYLDHLREHGRAEFTQPFRTSDRRGRVAYMIFGTNNCRGLEEMKRAMWKIDPTGMFRWKAKPVAAIGQGNFFAEIGNDQCEAEVADALQQQFGTKPVGMKDVEDYVRCQRDWLIRHLRPALTKLEDAGAIVKVEGGSGRLRRKGSFPPDSTITFK